MGSLEGNNQNHGFATKSSSNISIGDRICHGHIYDQALAASYLVSPNRDGDSTSNALEPNLLRPSNSYILMRSDNLETNVDTWIACCDNERNRRRDNVTSVGVQQPSMMAAHRALDSIWYMLALLPAISIQRRGWCIPSESFAAALSFVEQTSTYLKQIVSNARMRFSQLSIDQILNECFVIAMDFGLALHAFIFLVLAVYRVENCNNLPATE